MMVLIHLVLGEGEAILAKSWKHYIILIMFQFLSSIVGYAVTTLRNKNI